MGTGGQTSHGRQTVRGISSPAARLGWDDAALARSATFHRKLVLIALALANALLFRLVWQRRVEAGEDVPPLIGRTSAVASLAMWLGAGALGRLIAYS